MGKPLDDLKITNSLLTVRVSNGLIVVATSCESSSWEGDKLASDFGGKLKNAIIVNTCAVLLEYQETTNNYIKRLKSIFPDYKVYVTGCGSTYYPEAYVDTIIKDREKFNPESYGLTEKNIIPVNSYSVNIKVQDGCSHKCAYCITRFVKGASRSFPYEDIKKSIEMAIANGWKQLSIIGIDLAEYYYDGMYIKELCEQILKDFPDITIKTNNLDPANPQTLRFLELVKSEPRMVKQLHFPIQSGSDNILKLMRRRHTVKDIDNIYKSLEGYNIDTYWDLIVGFPGETEEDFIATYDLVNKYKPSFALVAPCCIHKGTEAADMPNKVPVDIKFKRIELLKKLILKNAHQMDEKGIISIRKDNFRAELSKLQHKEFVSEHKIIYLDLSKLEENSLSETEIFDLKVQIGEYLYLGYIHELIIYISDNTDIEIIETIHRWLVKLNLMNNVRFETK